MSLITRAFLIRFPKNSCSPTLSPAGTGERNIDIKRHRAPGRQCRLRSPPLNRDDEGLQEKKKRTEGQGRVWCFRFYGRLTHCLRGFNFYPLPRQPAPSRASSCVFLLAVPPTLFVADLPTYSDAAHATMLAGSSLRDKPVDNATAIRSRAPASGISSQLLFLSLLFPRLPFVSLLLSFYQDAGE